MLRFMVLGAPRSGTAWAANWFTAGDIRCAHDPLWDFHPSEFDAAYAGGGIACTGTAFFPDWVNANPCPKLILHRPRHEVQNSLHSLGLPDCPQRLFDNLWRIQGLHVPFWHLFTREIHEIHAHLKIGPVDQKRWDMLKDMTVTANYWKRVPKPGLIQRLRDEGAFA